MYQILNVILAVAIPITFHLENKKIKNLAKLLIKKYRNEDDRFLVSGKHLVMEAYKNGMLGTYMLCCRDTFL